VVECLTAAFGLSIASLLIVSECDKKGSDRPRLAKTFKCYGLEI